MAITILIAAAIGFAIALSGGLGSLDLEPGTLVKTGKSGGFVLRGEPGTFQDVTLPSEGLFNTFLIIFLVASLASAIFAVIDRESRPKLLIGLLALAVVVLILGIFFPRNLATRDQTFVEEETSASEEVLPGPTSESESRATAAPPEPSGGARWPLIVSAVLAAALAIVAITPLVVLLVRLVRRRRRTSTAVEEVLAIAEDAAREIESGADPVGVVQQCYARMLHALSKRYGVNPSFRTPREFAVDMRKAGLHSESVDDLTKMFELVRYGGRADGQFAQRAHACLSALRLSHESA